MAELYASENKIPIKIYNPDWKKYGKKAGILRNTDIVNAATHILAFPSKKSIGTFDTIKKAEKQKKLCKIIYID